MNDICADCIYSDIGVIGNPVDFWVISKFYEHSTHAKQQSLTDRDTVAALAHRGTHLQYANQSL